MTEPVGVAGGVDVVVPCYNYGRFLHACVHSVLDGAKRPVRVLIIDDRSTDETPQVASALAAAHPGVFYIRHETNIGHIATYNEGIRWAGSPYFVLLSADDLLAPGSLDRAASVLDAHPHVGLVYGRTLKFSGDKPPAVSADACPAVIIDGIDFIRTTFADSHNPIDSPASVIVRTVLQQQVGGYRPGLPHSGDLEMYLRLAARSSVGFLDVVQGLYRKHGANMSRGFEDLRDYEQRLAAFEAVCRDERQRLPDYVELLRTVRRTMAMELFWEASRAFDEGAKNGKAEIDARLAFAAALDPSLRFSRFWPALSVKRLLGRTWSRRASFFLDALISRSNHHHSTC